MLAAISVASIPVLSLSSLHLLWMLPSSFILGLASVVWPLKLLWIPASMYGSLWYIGTRDPARAFYLAGDYAKAIECYEQSILARRDSAEARFRLGLAYDKVGNTPKAIESFHGVIKMKPSSSEAYCNLGMCYKDIGNYAMAIDSFREALRIKPDYAKARGNLGLVYAHIGDIANALKEYQVLRTSNEVHAAALYSAITAKKG